MTRWFDECEELFWIAEVLRWHSVITASNCSPCGVNPFLPSKIEGKCNLLQAVCKRYFWKNSLRGRCSCSWRQGVQLRGPSSCCVCLEFLSDVAMILWLYHGSCAFHFLSWKFTSSVHRRTCSMRRSHLYAMVWKLVSSLESLEQLYYKKQSIQDLFGMNQLLPGTLSTAVPITSWLRQSQWNAKQPHYTHDCVNKSIWELEETKVLQLANMSSWLRNDRLDCPLLRMWGQRRATICTNTNTNTPLLLC